MSKQNFEKSFHFNPILIWSIAALFYFYENTLQVSQSIMVDTLMSDLKTTANSLSILASFYFWGYAFIQIPVGLLIDRYGIKKPILFAVLCCSIGAIMFSQVHHIYFAGLSRFIIGVGSAFAALSALQIAALYFSKEKFASLTGLLLTVGMIGQIFGEAPLNYLVNHYGWRHSILGMGLFGFVIILAVIVLMPNIQQKGEVHQYKSMKKDLFTLIKQPQPWIVAIYGMLMFTPFLILAGFWGVSFLEHAGAHSSQTAANLASLLPLGFAVGAPIIGYYSDSQKNQKNTSHYQQPLPNFAVFDITFLP